MRLLPSRPLVVGAVCDRGTIMLRFPIKMHLRSLVRLVRVGIGVLMFVLLPDVLKREDLNHRLFCRAGEREAILRNADPNLFKTGRIVCDFIAGEGGKAKSRKAMNETLKRAEDNLGYQVLARALADRAVIRLLAGRYSEAVALLEKAAKKNPTNAYVMSDLAAVYLFRMQAERQPGDLLKAFRAADRALALDPFLVEAVYNRALALEQLYLHGAAQREWEIYAALDRKSRWTSESKVRLRASNAEYSSPDDKVERLLEQSGEMTQEQIRQIVNKFTYRSRIYLQEHLMLQVATRRENPDVLQKASFMAESIGKLTGDRMLADAVDVARAASDDEVVRLLATGHLEYRRGRISYSRSDYDNAAKRFAVAERLLQSAGSPFALRAAYAQACSLHFLALRKDALKLLGLVEQESRARRYWALHAESLWMIGLARFAMGDLGLSLEAYRDALDSFVRIHELDNAASVHFLLVENLDYQGASDQVWIHGYEALRAASRIDDPQRRFQIYSVIATAMFHDNLTGLALRVQDEAVRNARILDNPSAVASAHFWRARYLHRMGRLKEAKGDIDQARAAATEIASEAARAKAVANVALIEAEISADTNTFASIELFDEAIENNRSAEARYHEIEIMLARSRALRGLGSNAEAIENLQQCISLIEKKRSTIRDPSLRIGFLDNVYSVYADLVRLKIDLGEYGSAFEYLERGRARTLLDISDKFSRSAERELGETFGPMGLDKIAAKLSPRTVMINFAVNGEEVFTWVITQAGLVRFERLGNGQYLRGMIVDLEASLVDPDISNARRIMALLYSQLLAPLADTLVIGSHLVIVPDDFLYRVPFAALYNAGSSRYLVEGYSISISPSAMVYVRALGKGGTADFQNILLLGDPAFDPRQFSGMQRLRAPAQEFEILRLLFPQAHYLHGQEATKEEFLRLSQSADLVHFSGHAVANEDAPLWSFLIMASSKRTSGSGLLYVHEIYGLRYRRPRLLVLASCGSARGRESLSEGPQSIARAFLSAGISTVLGAIGPVEDASTGELLTNFYGHLKKGERPMYALQKAQLGMLRKGGRLEWALFQIFGGDAG